MNEGERRTANRAAEQYGLATHNEALAFGMSPRTIHRRSQHGDWEELFHHVYRLPGTPRTGRQLAMAATLWGGPEAGGLTGPADAR
jgi:Transcriptional regulator, AbiEi antitoxin